MYLVDTDVLSVGAPDRRNRSAELVNWMDAHSGELFLSAVTVTEICNGIAKLKRTGTESRAAAIEDWLDLVLHLYGDRVLSLDKTAARLAGNLLGKAHRSGRSPEFADIAIEATAGSLGLTVMTRNLRHFAPLGIAAIDPVRTLP